MARIVYRCDFCEERFPNLADAEKCEQMHTKLAVENPLKVIAMTPSEGFEKNRIYVRDKEGLVFEYVRNREAPPFRLSVTRESR